MQNLHLKVIWLFICCFILSSTAGVDDETVKHYGPVKSGDILWDIAGKIPLADTSVTRYQVMFALFKANTQAFHVPCNIHSPLKVGKTLKIPSLAEMQAVSHTEVMTLFNQQQTIWKRRREQAIVCPVNSAQEEVIQITHTKEQPVVENPALPLSQSISVVTESKQEQTTILSPEFVTTFPLPTSAIISLSVLVSLFFLALFVGWLLHRYVPQKQPVKENNKQPPEDNPESVPLKSPESPPSEPLDELNQARACLAQGDTQTAKTHLTHVINTGQPEQQQEAHQLLKITMQMSTLELRATQSQQKVESEKPGTASQLLTKMDTHLSVPQYLLEDEMRLSEFVSKIFTFIDQELNAQGKLVTAYNQLDKPTDLNSEDYRVMEQAIDEDTQKKSRERKPTRYL